MSTAFGQGDLSQISAVSFDLSDWTQIEMSGPDAKKFLQNFCTNDIQKLTEGQTCEAFICDIKGRILAHVLVCAVAEDLRLFSSPGTADGLLRHLSKYLLDADVTLHDCSQELGLLCVCGEAAVSVLDSALGITIDAAVGKCRSVNTSAGPLLLAGTDMVAAPAILISGSREPVTALRERIPVNLLALGTAQLFEILRIEAGFPIYGQDISADLIAQSAARTERAINFQKGCYLGQEPIARLDALGHTNQELRGVFVPGTSVKAGDAIVLDDQELGRITSAADSPARDGSVALALIKTSHAAPGSALQIRTAGGRVPGTVYWPHLPQQ